MGNIKVDFVNQEVSRINLITNTYIQEAELELDYVRINGLVKAGNLNEEQWDEVLDTLNSTNPHSYSLDSVRDVLEVRFNGLNN